MLSVPTFQEYNQTRNHWYISMEMLGPSLDQLLQFCGGKFSLHSTIKLGKELVRNLKELHDKRIVHCDLKPLNITVGVGSNTNWLYLIDFGISDFFMDHKFRHVEKK